MFELQNSNSKASAIPFSSSPLKFPSLCTDIGLGVAMGHTRSWSKVLDSLTGILGTSKKNRILAEWSSKSQLIKGEAFATSLLNSSSGSFSEPQGSYLQSRDFIHPNVIGHGPDYHSYLILLSLGVTNQSREG